jgi:hypothetical protein
MAKAAGLAACILALLFVMVCAHQTVLRMPSTTCDSPFRADAAWRTLPQLERTRPRCGPGGLPRPASATSSLGLGFEDGQSHGSSNNSVFGAHGRWVAQLRAHGGVQHLARCRATTRCEDFREAAARMPLCMRCSAPMVSGGLAAAGGGNPRSLITWDSFNSTDFNTLKSAVGLTNVSAAFAWQSPPTLASHSMPLGGDSAFARMGSSSAGMTGPAAVPVNGYLGSRSAADAAGGATGSFGGGGGSPYGSSPYSGSLGAGSSGVSTASLPLLGDALPPMAAPPGLTSTLQQVQRVLRV